MNNDDILTCQEVADILKISKYTVYELIKRGELVAYKVGNKMRIASSEVEAYKKRSTSSHINEHHEVSNTIVEDYYSTPPVIGEHFPKPAGFIICGQDTTLDILSKHLEQHPNGTYALRSYVGSYNGLYMLYQGKVHIASAHLWDSKTGEYNIPYVERMLPGTPAVIIRLFNRIQGFYVTKGNPKGIKSWKDLNRKDISIMNREKGSGTRVLLDEHLRIEGINPYQLQGYTKECFSHLAVASAVARGSADFGIGVRSYARVVSGIDFIPVQTENYDIVIKKEDFNKPQFQAVYEIIRSRKFRLEIEGLGEYDTKDLGKIVAET